MSVYFFLVLQCAICFFLIIFILLQKTSSDSLAGVNPEFNTKSIFSRSTTKSLIQRIVLILIFAFLISSIVLANRFSSKTKELKSKIIQSQEIEVRK